MLILGQTAQSVHWPQAGITLNLIPLLADANARFVEETITVERDDKNNITRRQRDIVKYAKLVGRHCIKGWSGVVNADKQPIECTPEAIDNFMLIEQAQEFVFKQVNSLSIITVQDIGEAKKD